MTTSGGRPRSAGTLLSAIQATGGALHDQHIVIFGAGTAGIGIRQPPRPHHDGRGDEQDARSRLRDGTGLVSLHVDTCRSSISSVPSASRAQRWETDRDRDGTIDPRRREPGEADHAHQCLGTGRCVQRPISAPAMRARHATPP